MYRIAYSNSYTKGVKTIVGGIERLREKAKSLRYESPQIDIDIPTAPKLDQEMLTRKELGKLFKVSHEAIWLWEESGKLKQLGWERIPQISSPVKYSRTNQPVVPVPPVFP